MTLDPYFNPLKDKMWFVNTPRRVQGTKPNKKNKINCEGLDKIENYLEMFLLVDLDDL